MTRRQSKNELSGGITPHTQPKIPIAKNSLEIFSPRFLGSTRLSLHQLSSKGLNYQRGVLLISAGAIEGHLKKTPREFHQGSLVLVHKKPALRAIATQKYLSYLGFHYLDHPPYSPDLAPLNYHLFPVLKKKTIEYSQFIVRRESLCCRGDLVGGTTF